VLKSAQTRQWETVGR